jgi:hypothetical protein
MKRDWSARRRIREYLAASGPITDPSGHATGLLMEAVEYAGSPVAFIQLVSAMEKAGELEREIRGKRTFRIANTADVPASGRPQEGDTPVAAPPVGGHAVDIDYDRLARAIVRELWSVVLEAARDRVAVSEPSTGLDSVLAERDEYARRLQAARRSLDDLLGAEEAGDTDRPHRLSPTA